MKKNTQRLFAVGMILFGGLMVMSNFLDISFGKVSWALIIILVGVALITRPEIFRGEGIYYKFIGDVNLDESWAVEDYGLRALITDIDLDLEFAEFPEGETNMNFSFFVGDVTISTPEDVGLRIKTNAFVTESKLPDNKGEFFMTGFKYQTEGYEEAEKKLDVQLNGFVVEINA